MAQYDLHRNPDPRSQERVPYLLDVQADIASDLPTRVVVPLVRADAYAKPIRILNPIVEVDGDRLVLLTPELAGVAARCLGERVGSLAEERAAVIAALDLLLTGV